MFLLSSPEMPNKNNILSVSTIPSQEVLNDPLRELFYASRKDEKLYLLIARRIDSASLPNKIKWVSTANGSDRTLDYEYINEDSINSTVIGPANAQSVITVGASDIQNPLEPRKYSSQGGATILFDPAGQKLSEPLIREKPDLFAPDSVSTTFGTETSFNPFRGTSAAAPQVAAVAALMLERGGSGKNLFPEKIRSLLQETALQIQSSNVNAGLVQADRAIINSFSMGYVGSEGDDSINGTSSAENFYGQRGNDTIEGFGGNDYLSGEIGNDILLGGSNNDILLGGTGYNILIGGEGKDTFVLENNGTALISDFDPKNDTLAISGEKNMSNLEFSPLRSNYTLVKNGEIPLALIFNMGTSDNLNILFLESIDPTFRS
jgi:Ca2+-binding RTX toxin-like protein